MSRLRAPGLFLSLRSTPLKSFMRPERLLRLPQGGSARRPASPQKTHNTVFTIHGKRSPRTMGWPGWNYELLKHAEADCQVFLGIFADRLYQIARFDQHLIGIVVHRWVFKQLARAAFARFQPVRNDRKFFNNVLQLAGKLFILQ